MVIDPSTMTLREETPEEQAKREAEEDVIGSGLTVFCRPDPTDPSIVEQQHRLVCATKPYAACHTCRHGTFVLFFKAQPSRYAQVSCPRWSSEAERYKGSNPETYEMVEEARCEERPYSFCSSCPSKKDVATCGADKVRPGWYARWERLRKDAEDG